MISTLSVNMYAEETTKPIIEEEILQEIIFDFANPEINGLITKDKIKTALRELDMIT